MAGWQVVSFRRLGVGQLVGRLAGCWWRPRSGAWTMVGRLNGWLAVVLISGGWVSVSWFVGWLAVGGGWAVRAVESAVSAAGLEVQQ